MTIQLPLTLGDKIWHMGRVQSYVNDLEFDINSEGVDLSTLRIGSKHETPSHVSYLHEKNPTELNRPLTFNPPHNVGDTIYYLNSTYGNVGILCKGEIKSIQCKICEGFSLYYYRVNGYSGMINKYSLYSSVEDFKRRTQNLTELKVGEKFIFTKYLMQQNKLKVLKLTKHSSTHFKSDRGEIIRGSELYNSNEKFFNKFLAQVD
jgi:hypothetical protein